ncbi:ankyrin repeat protein [Histomonas meleagridis]|uniref:ankyrin repeat protein n=1 Tax=Histomonas meleagridis TaxID=135588 RepID=UPI0035598DF0|nr:ankyrin repeat protein [Histomonas meleagridis]KAH0805268.1 ankyrin repeat protein [Histomonas meleagridis]
MEFALKFGSYEICEYLVKERGLDCEDFFIIISTGDLNKLKLFEKRLKKKVYDDFDEMEQFACMFHAPYIIDYLIDNYPGCREEEDDDEIGFLIQGYNTVDWYKRIKDLPTFDKKIIKNFVASGQIHILKYFLNQAPEKIKFDDSAFKMAGKFGDIETIKYMMSTKEYQSNKEKCLQKILEGALKGQESKAVDFLIDNGAKLTDDLIFSGLNESVYYDYPGFIQFLVDQYNARLDIISKKNETLLMTAAKDGNNDLCELILGSGVNINQQNNNGYTALMYAVEKVKRETVELLIGKGTNANLQNNDGNTAIILACSSSLCINFNIIQMLSDAGADFLIENKIGKTAINYAHEKGVLNDVLMIKPELRQICERLQLKQIPRKDSDDEPKNKAQSANSTGTKSMAELLATYDPEYRIRWVENLVNFLLYKKIGTPQEKAKQAKNILNTIPNDLIEPSSLQKLKEIAKYETKDEDDSNTSSDQ